MAEVSTVAKLLVIYARTRDIILVRVCQGFGATFSIQMATVHPIGPTDNVVEAPDPHQA